MTDTGSSKTDNQTLDAAFEALRAFAPALDTLGSARFAKIIAHALPDHLDAFNTLLSQCYQAQLNALPSALSPDQRPDDQANPPPERGFDDPAWLELPFYRWVKAQYLTWTEFWTKLPEVLELQGDERKVVEFALRQWREAAAPTNYLPLNPAAVRKAFATQGESLQKGALHFARDIESGRVSMSHTGAFKVGETLAATPGDVIFENDLIQLLQYQPRSAKVRARPLLIVPPFINKYYVLDLRPENSLVRYALENGHQVFMISWRNIGDKQQQATWDDYLAKGVLKALDVALAVTRQKSANLVGFCVGGTLSACAAAIDAASHQARLHSLTLLATLLDFSDSGDISVYIDNQYVTRCETQYQHGGIVKGAQLANAFASLRPRDLMWHFFERNYLLGETPAPFDLLYWNDDSANVPGKLFAYYLRQMYLENRLREPNVLRMCGIPIDLRNIRIPTYFLAAKDDHIVPWQSAWLGTRLMGGTTQFVLTESGHIAGVINPPNAKRRGYWRADSSATSSAAWLDAAQYARGSWWDDWLSWLRPFAGAARGAPKHAGNASFAAIEPAPGRYVRELPKLQSSSN